MEIEISCEERIILLTALTIYEGEMLKQGYKYQATDPLESSRVQESRRLRIRLTKVDH